MRSFDTATGDILAARAGIKSRVLLWITAKNRSTGDPETVGLWNGEDDRVFSVGGDDRTYIGAGPMREVGLMKFEIGLKVRMHTIVMSPLHEKVEQVFREYDARLAPAQMHRVLFDTDTNEPAGTPHRVLKGQIDEIDVSIDDTSEASIVLASNAIFLTRSLAIKKSDESQRRRNASDLMRQHGGVTAAVSEVWWGQLKGRPETDTRGGSPGGRSRSGGSRAR